MLFRQHEDDDIWPIFATERCSPCPAAHHLLGWLLAQGQATAPRETTQQIQATTAASRVVQVDVCQHGGRVNDACAAGGAMMQSTASHQRDRVAGHKVEATADHPTATARCMPRKSWMYGPDSGIRVLDGLSQKCSNPWAHRAGLLFTGMTHCSSLILYRKRPWSLLLLHSNSCLTLFSATT